MTDFIIKEKGEEIISDYNPDEAFSNNESE